MQSTELRVEFHFKPCRHVTRARRFPWCCLSHARQITGHCGHFHCPEKVTVSAAVTPVSCSLPSICIVHRGKSDYTADMWLPPDKMKPHHSQEDTTRATLMNPITYFISLKDIMHPIQILSHSISTAIYIYLHL